MGRYRGDRLTATGEQELVMSTHVLHTATGTMVASVRTIRQPGDCLRNGSYRLHCPFCGEPVSAPWSHTTSESTGNIRCKECHMDTRYSITTGNRLSGRATITLTVAADIVPVILTD